MQNENRWETVLLKLKDTEPLKHRDLKAYYYRHIQLLGWDEVAVKCDRSRSSVIKDAKKGEKIAQELGLFKITTDDDNLAQAQPDTEPTLEERMVAALELQAALMMPDVM